MHKLTWAFCLFLSLLFAPALQAEPVRYQTSTLTIGDSAAEAVTPSDVHAWEVPDTPFILVAHDAGWPCLSLHNGSRHPRSHQSAKAHDPDGDGYASPAVSRLSHAVDYGGV
ncbi:MAG TPA: hypothetical protein VIF37_16300 [Methylobacter sp.]|jgi:hypothetical protein